MEAAEFIHFRRVAKPTMVAFTDSKFENDYRQHIQEHTY